MERAPGFAAEADAQEEAGTKRSHFGISPTGSVTTMG